MHRKVNQRSKKVSYCRKLALTIFAGAAVTIIHADNAVSSSQPLREGGTSVVQSDNSNLNQEQQQHEQPPPQQESSSWNMYSLADVPVWIFGVFLVICQAAFSASGLALQRYAKLKADLPNQQSSYAGPESLAPAAVDPAKHNRKIKRLTGAGMLLYGLSQPLNAVAVTLCPISVVGPLCSSSIIIFSVMTAGFLGEVYTKTDIIAVTMSLCGTVGIVSFSPRQDEIGDKELSDNTKILEFWRHPGLCFFIFCIFGMLIYAVKVVRDQNNLPENAARSQWQKMQGALAYPVMSGCLAVCSESLTKAVGVFVAQGWAYMWSHILTLVLLVSCMAFVGITCFLVVSLGAQKFDSRYFLPAYCATSSFFFGMYGVSIGEFANHPPTSTFLFGVFSLFAVVSVVMASMHAETTPQESAHQDMGELGARRAKRLTSISRIFSDDEESNPPDYGSNGGSPASPGNTPDRTPLPHPGEKPRSYGNPDKELSNFSRPDGRDPRVQSSPDPQPQLIGAEEELERSYNSANRSGSRQRLTPSEKGESDKSRESFLNNYE